VAKKHHESNTHASSERRKGSEDARVTEIPQQNSIF